MAFTGMILKHGLDVAMSLPVYTESREKGHGAVYSTGKMLLSVAAWGTLGPIMAGIQGAQIASAVGEVGMQLGRESALNTSNAYRANFGGNYVDTQNAYTLRQRGLQAIENSRLNARNVLGSEARMYHRSVKDWY